MRAQLLGSFVVFFLLGLILARDSLNYPWFHDDLHLVRPYSSSEIAAAFVGTMDPDHIETVGYRPFAVLFYDLRALAFGDAMAAHRVFQVALFAGCLSLLSTAALNVGMTFWEGLGGGALALTAKNNWLNLVWLTDGVRPFVGLLFGISLLAVLSHLRSPARWKVGLSLVAMTAAVLVREDVIALFPLVPVFGYAALRIIESGSSRDPSEATETARGRLIRVSLGLLAVLGAFAFARVLFVGAAGGGLDPFGAAYLAYKSLFPMGVIIERARLVLWLALLLLMAGHAWFFLPRETLRRAALWGAAILITCAPGLIVARPNILFFPILFFSFAFAYVVGEQLRSSRWAAAPAATIFLFVFALSGDRSMVAQQAMHPLALESLELSYEWVWGQWSGATIPANRIEQIKERLHRLGINSSADFAALFPQLAAKAEASRSNTPGRDNAPFVPRTFYGTW